MVIEKRMEIPIKSNRDETRTVHGSYSQQRLPVKDINMGNQPVKETWVDEYGGLPQKQDVVLALHKGLATPRRIPFSRQPVQSVKPIAFREKMIIDSWNIARHALKVGTSSHFSLLWRKNGCSYLYTAGSSIDEAQRHSNNWASRYFDWFNIARHAYKVWHFHVVDDYWVLVRIVFRWKNCTNWTQKQGPVRNTSRFSGLYAS